ncbi:hypothetical protein PB01_15040 [Psychrobacillus glaciei]|uniref:Uncharacterized protein n=1 Tax=Psychrobacillus glaciei TaxID=2283160 RepID=A0A5J6ST05_9BACI|nr:hypothetical protein PB01_15040 [Psychrobacillus glaciei]
MTPPPEAEETPTESEYQSAKSRWLLFRLHVAHYINNAFFADFNKFDASLYRYSASIELSRNL